MFARIDTSLLHSSWQYYICPLFYLFFIWNQVVNHAPLFQIWIVMVLYPFLDCILPFDNRNPSKEEIKQLDNQLKFKLPLYVFVGIDWFYVLYIQKWFYETHASLSYLEIVWTVWATALLMAGNINVAHELLHKNNFLDKFLGLTTLSKNMYLHFYIEHVHGHHRRVATKEDPTSSRRNETLYQFLPRTLIGSWISAWQFEEKKVGSKEFSLYNRMHMFTICYFIFPLVAKMFFGWIGLIFFLVTSIFSAIHLEIINYVEHYGLERKEISSGVYEKVDIKHSWNAPHRFTNYVLYKLQRHSDHHENAYKPYQTLCSYEESPVLPHGYPVCLILAMNPKDWFEVMNQKVDDYKSGIKRSEKEVKKINWKIYKVLAKQAVVLTTLWVLEILGFMKLI